MPKQRRQQEKLPDALPTVPGAPLKLYTETEVAAMFRVSKRTFVDFIGKHSFYRKLGKQKLFTETDIMLLYEHLDDPPYGRAQEKPKICFHSPASEAARLEKLMMNPAWACKQRPKVREQT